MILLAFGIAVVFIAIALIVYARWNYGTLEKMNIPVVKPSFLLGSTPDLHLKVQHLEDVLRFQKHGKVFGVYEGRKPVVFICDPDLLRLIMVKDVEYFKDRRAIDLGDEQVNEMMDFLPYDKWKEVRNPMTPFFTLGKIKLVSQSMKESITDLCTSIRADCNFNKDQGFANILIDQKFEAFYMDLSFRSAFGIKIDDHLSPTNEVLKMFREISGQDAEFDFLYTLTMSFPFLTRFAPTLDTNATKKIGATFRNVLSARRSAGQKNNDFADILNEMIAKTSSPQYKKLGITDTTIVAQAFNFILAGYDAMKTISTMLTYYLVKHPEMQEKLHEEIDAFLERNNGEIIFEKLGELVYLNACLYETMRLVPPFIRPERICTKDWEHENLKIKKGTMIMIPAWAVHRDPEQFPDPEEFKPERFLPENKSKMHQYSFMTFGNGPRNCIGMRFAVEAMKYAFVHILKEFRFEMRHDTVIKYKPGVLFFVQYNHIPINVTKRA
ncbi:Cytochrome P450 3A56 [Orchesella cincta]|uniref:Cytochrome P450 3A56 n=1 Tax=Orchesella cincta TaxID=48709 RepID=A0A1D2N1D7_ORCCI|nr:Cytochrome P450 3A56 [Orchesella cincta]